MEKHQGIDRRAIGGKRPVLTTSPGVDGSLTLPGHSAKSEVHARPQRTPHRAQPPLLTFPLALLSSPLSSSHHHRQIFEHNASQHTSSKPSDTFVLFSSLYYQSFSSSLRLDPCLLLSSEVYSDSTLKRKKREKHRSQASLHMHTSQLFASLYRFAFLSSIVEAYFSYPILAFESCCCAVSIHSSSTENLLPFLFLRHPSP